MGTAMHIHVYNYSIRRVFPSAWALGVVFPVSKGSKGMPRDAQYMYLSRCAISSNNLNLQIYQT